VKNLLILLFFIIPTNLLAEKISEYPLGKWPLLAKYEASECLDVDDDRLDFIPHAKSDRETVFLSLPSPVLAADSM